MLPQQSQKPEQPRRILYPNSYYHIFNRGNHKKLIFHSSHDYEVFLSLLEKYLTIYDSIDLQAYCLMPNHFHFLIKTDSKPEDLIKLMQRFMTSYVIFFNKKYKQVGHLFQGRYSSKYLQYKYDVQRVYNYIKRNPLEAGLSRRPEDYRWIWLGELPFYTFDKKKIDEDKEVSKF